MGGLGNYMFQIAAALSLAEDNSTKSSFNFKNAQRIHNDISTYKSNLFRKITVDDDLNIKNTYVERDFFYSPIRYEGKDLRLHGYFQSEKYFKHNRDLILKTFDLDKSTKDYVDRKYGSLFLGDTISLHVRRGDYVRLKHVYGDLFKRKYYKKAISIFPDKRYTVLVFSDDIAWCKKNLDNRDHNFIYIDGELDYVDMYMMSLCKNHIIANSSFSWWGAWLSKHKNTISPYLWFNPSSKDYDDRDLVPENWIKI